ncbi:conjugative transposon protein TraM [Chryseobacterium indologenes]|uniref:conjugative transposon protein TraM n=1 Tax=Chryseobacterium indologenes TaxID=253 RepID=UPI000B51D5B1|nr:conjugative transposon protein TraM [Chryseobacterium indologenes]ASE62061.1 conjugative transposon protein TraM [Chryseobacterium indologenes]
MENNENKRVSILVEESDHKSEDILNGNEKSRLEKLKKPLIYLVMGIVFLACLYLIFKPSANKDENKDSGLNGAVPQATEIGMQSDKQKAYEQAMMDEKNQQKKNMLTSLSDYWNSDSTMQAADQNSGLKGNPTVSPSAKNYQAENPALNSYRNAQATLGSFYNSNENYESNELRKEIAGLKRQLDERDANPAPLTVNDQLQLMEKSYQMASKYLPSSSAEQKTVDSSIAKNTPVQKTSFTAFSPMRSNVVSALYREPTDEDFLADVNGERNRGFYTVGVTEQVSKPKNSIRACIHENTTISIDGTVKLRLLESAKTPDFTIPSGSIVTAGAKFGNGRLQLKISSIETSGNIFPVEINIYDLDGQPGLNVPYSAEMNALTEIASNMSQSSGTSIMMTRSAGQQVAGDLSRGLVQGISGYFSKKVRTPKVMLKAGHQVFLVSKK